MNKKYRRYLEILCHVLLWVVPTFMIIRNNMMSYAGLTTRDHPIPLIISVLINILIVYSNIFVIFPAYSRKRLNLPNYLLILVLMVVAGAVLKVRIDDQFVRYYFSREPGHEAEGYVMELFVNSFFALQSFLYCIVKEWIKNSIIQRKLKEEKLSMELKYLKSQINPHFLFNTLNNLYSVALKNNDNETATGITRLSHIMRFMLDEVNENYITLDKEVRYLESYIDLQKLRFSSEDDIKVSFKVLGDTSKIKIPPFIFIVFIENAFKHGVNYKKQSFIEIELEVTGDNRLSFRIKNSIHNFNESGKSGLGLKNIRERLELLFPDKYNLQINRDSNIFNLELDINLSN
jgi:two-component system LytT family sensor kinase